MTKVAELYGISSRRHVDWKAVVDGQQCPFLARKCLKNRKSEADLTIGSCTMNYGKGDLPTMICPFRLLERGQVFTDCIHLLKLREPGDELRIVGELAVPGGSIDYCLVSVRDGKPRDFVAIELQAMDSTGTVWPERQRFLKAHGVDVSPEDAASSKTFGINWKMTAKTILVQLNHKVETFDQLGKHLVLVMQDRLLDYIRKAFAFDHVKGVRDGDPMHFHAYELRQEDGEYTLKLRERLSTDAAGVAASLGLQVDARVDLAVMLKQIEAKLPQSTLLTLGGTAIPISETMNIEADEG